MLKIVVAHSEDPNSQDAIEEVLEQCISQLADKISSSGFVICCY